MSRFDYDNLESKPINLYLSLIVAVVTALFITSSMGPAIVKPLLLDGSLISNGRFAFVYDAYETIEDDGAVSVVGIGSSILMAGMNGTCMQEESQIENTRFYNMAMSGGKPYSEMIQIPALVEAKPDVVMVEIGPNSLYGWDGTQYIEGITDYNEFRFQLMSMGMTNEDIDDWYELLDPIDQNWIDTNQFDRFDAWSEYSRDAIEEYLRREIDGNSSALNPDSYSYVPEFGSKEWDQYLSEPNWRPSKFDSKSPTDIREYLDERMPSKSKQGVYNPKESNTQNHRALDYIIHSLLNASIEVVLVGIPHHPWVNEYLESSQLDGMNSTYDRYLSLEGITALQMYWEEWPSQAFSDRNHLDAEGRLIFCQRVTPIIDAVLIGGDPYAIQIDPNVFEIKLSDNDECLGSNENLILKETENIIEVENYSVCYHGAYYIDSTWQFVSEQEITSGLGYMVSLPDTKSNSKDTTDGPYLGYNLSILTEGKYYVWIRMFGPDGGGDSIHVGINGEPLTYGGNGLTTSPPSQWNWVHTEINISSVGNHQLGIWMREDGVKLDSLIITSNGLFDPSDSQIIEPLDLCYGGNETFSNDLTFTEDQGLIIIEAEEYSTCSFGSMQAQDSLWDLDFEISGFTGQGYMVANPDVKTNIGDSTDGPRLSYNLSLYSTGIHHVWIRMSAPDGGGDSIHVGLNGNPLTYGGVGFSTSPNGEWNWEIITINVTSTGLNQLDISMREDGVRIDSLVITSDLEFIPG
jgi:hypothetical protein